MVPILYPAAGADASALVLRPELRATNNAVPTTAKRE